MKPPCLSDLPPAPEGKTGWPWTVESLPVPGQQADCNPWPRVSIVTPSYNQGRFLEETIRSVLLQGYPNLEYLIIDGGSTDDSVAIIKKYEPWITNWASEPDRGQSHAINKGFKKTTGDIIGWLNSDDMLQPNAVYLAACYLVDNPAVGMVTGDREIIDAASRRIGERNWQKFVPWQFKYCSGVAQEASFWRRTVFFECGQLDENLHYAMDLDLWIRIQRKTKIHHIPVQLGIYRSHRDSISMQVKRVNKGATERIKKMIQEEQLVRLRHYGINTLSCERFLLPRLQNLLGKLEVRFGDYASKKRYFQEKLNLLQATEENSNPSASARNR